jgi:hypothetical protein
MAAWIGVDLDGTLAHYDQFSEIDFIGEPVPLMVERVKRWRGRGQKVKIFTARASVPELVPVVEEWLARHGLADLEITNIKDFEMIELWDDRCVRVLTNTGFPLSVHALSGIVTAVRLLWARSLNKIEQFSASREAPPSWKTKRGRVVGAVVRRCVGVFTNIWIPGSVNAFSRIVMAARLAWARIIDTINKFRASREVPRSWKSVVGHIFSVMVALIDRLRGKP